MWCGSISGGGKWKTGESHAVAVIECPFTLRYWCGASAAFLVGVLFISVSFRFMSPSWKQCLFCASASSRPWLDMIFLGLSLACCRRIIIFFKLQWPAVAIMERENPPLQNQTENRRDGEPLFQGGRMGHHLIGWWYDCFPGQRCFSGGFRFRNRNMIGMLCMCAAELGRCSMRHLWMDHSCAPAADGFDFDAKRGRR
jgi:hypothetical protein